MLHGLGKAYRTPASASGSGGKGKKIATVLLGGASGNGLQARSSANLVAVRTSTPTGLPA